MSHHTKSAFIRQTLLGLGLMLGSTAPSIAQEPAPGTEPVSGAAAQTWLELQKSGTAASPTPRPLPGEIAERSYERYANSFSTPIPDELGREGFLSGGGGK